MRVVGYVRVSTSEQADSGAGLEAQRQAIESACQIRGWELATLVEDAGVSAKNLRRPGLTKVLTLLDTGEADGLVVAKIDRLSRSLLDFTTLMERSRKKGWALVALDIGVDTTSPSGELMANTVANFAQFERRLIGQRTKDALAVKKAQGVRLGRPRALPVKVVKDIERQRAKGRSLRAIAENLNDRDVPTAHGGRQWYPATISKVLKSATP